ncbi:hypothetical protein Mal15_43290 [Stieleria maiorica]|uniref:Uncharacterized protein n=1 Tax=Stieleria maiorica TaxID=2795974 RepID=A0A5B9MGG8_9BACT|nr:DUF5691 domain-containing protein [Stieleria maiorica]QEG00259.1 hypothetical protein Mal15_43290 [Stieleria maiorica]
MASDLLQTLNELKGCWMIGSSAVGKTPASWRAAVQDDPNPDLALLALAGQAMQFALRATPGGELKVTPTLPALSLPTPPPQARQHLRHLIRIIKLTESQTRDVMHLLAARGYVVHPADYMPKSFDQLPDVYAPWASWQNAEQEGDTTGEYDQINADNWDAWMPAERRAALSTLRRTQPEAARQLVADKAASVPAGERLRIIETFGEALCAEDQSLLEGFVKDRSAKVRRLVEQYLARIGAAEDEAADVAEFADFFSVAKKLLRGGYKITANRLKTTAQRKRRDELAAKLSLKSFVQGLGLSDETELIRGWEHVDEEASDSLVRMVAATGNELAVATMATCITSLDGISAEGFQQLFDRLGKDSRGMLLPRVLENDDASLSAAVVCAQGLWGEITFEQLKPLRALKELKKLAGQDTTKNTVGQQTLRRGLFSLGLLADQAAATELLAMFTDSNLFASDPMLGLLKLNACLPPGEPL